MAGWAKELGVGLRPHAKTHKTAAIARLQLDAGAAGLTVAKLGEAEALVAAGISTSFMLAHPVVGETNVGRALALAEAVDELLLCTDDVEASRAVASAAGKAGTEAQLVLIVDSGYGRFGVAPERAASLAAELAALPGAVFRGIHSYAGHAYGGATAPEREQIAVAEARLMRETAAAIAAAGIPCGIVSVGSTPGTRSLAGHDQLQGVTEIRPGNYVFFDRMQVSLGTADVSDCALRVVTTVVSAPEAGRALVDAGMTALTNTVDDLSEGFGLVLDRPDVVLVRLSQEAGTIRYAGAPLRPGDRLVVVPNHACEIPNVLGRLAYGTDGAIEGEWVPEARGAVA